MKEHSDLFLILIKYKVFRLLPLSIMLVVNLSCLSFIKLKKLSFITSLLRIFIDSLEFYQMLLFTSIQKNHIFLSYIIKR